YLAKITLLFVFLFQETVGHALAPELRSTREDFRPIFEKGVGLVTRTKIIGHIKTAVANSKGIQNLEPEPRTDEVSLPDGQKIAVTIAPIPGLWDRFKIGAFPQGEKEENLQVIYVDPLFFRDERAIREAKARLIKLLTVGVDEKVIPNVPASVTEDSGEPVTIQARAERIANLLLRKELQHLTGTLDGLVGVLKREDPGILDGARNGDEERILVSMLLTFAHCENNVREIVKARGGKIEPATFFEASRFMKSREDHALPGGGYRSRFIPEFFSDGLARAEREMGDQFLQEIRPIYAAIRDPRMRTFIGRWEYDYAKHLTSLSAMELAAEFDAVKGKPEPNIYDRCPGYMNVGIFIGDTAQAVSPGRLFGAMSDLRTHGGTDFAEESRASVVMRHALLAVYMEWVRRHWASEMPESVADIPEGEERIGFDLVKDTIPKAYRNPKEPVFENDPILDEIYAKITDSAAAAIIDGISKKGLETDREPIAAADRAFRVAALLLREDLKPLPGTMDAFLKTIRAKDPGILDGARNIDEEKVLLSIIVSNYGDDTLKMMLRSRGMDVPEMILKGPSEFMMARDDRGMPGGGYRARFIPEFFADGVKRYAEMGRLKEASYLFEAVSDPNKRTFIARWEYEYAKYLTTLSAKELGDEAIKVSGKEGEPLKLFDACPAYQNMYIFHEDKYQSVMPGRAYWFLAESDPRDYAGHGVELVIRMHAKLAVYMEWVRRHWAPIMPPSVADIPEKDIRFAFDLVKDTMTQRALSELDEPFGRSPIIEKVYKAITDNDVKAVVGWSHTNREEFPNSLRQELNGLPGKLGISFDIKNRIEKREDGWNALFGDEARARKFLKLASSARELCVLEGDRERFRPPLVYAREKGLVIHLGSNLYMTPVSESYRRHIIFALDKNGGKELFRFEVVIPSPAKPLVDADKRSTIAGDLRERYGNWITPHPFASGDFPSGVYDMYGEDIEFGPMKVMGIDYPFDAHRFSHYSLKRLNELAAECGVTREDLDRHILSGVARLTAMIHSAGYLGHYYKKPLKAGGVRTFETDWHADNIRLVVDTNRSGLDKVRMTLVGDFTCFSRANEYDDPGKEMEIDISKLVVPGTDRNGAGLLWSIFRDRPA
ncbi:MAG: hypothetical protein HQL30_08785, partial [Candidatus Omnitrophica bacterium]|nr:hypothetical protein [Candidatus Omnitrophota bacterium]